MLKYAGITVAVLGAAFLIATLLLGRKNKIGESIKELSLIEGAGYASHHSARDSMGIREEGIAKDIKVAPKKRALSKEAQSLLEQVEKEKREEREGPSPKEAASPSKASKVATGVMKREGKRNEQTGVLKRIGEDGSREQTGVLKKGAGQSREQTGTLTRATDDIREQTGTLQRTNEEDRTKTGILGRASDEEGGVSREATGNLKREAPRSKSSETGVLNREKTNNVSDKGGNETGILRR